MPKDSIHSYHRFMWENLFSHVDIDPANVHIPPGEIRREKVGEAARAYEAAIARSRRNRLPDSRHRQDGTHRLQRARLGRGQPHAPRDARRRDAQRCRGRFLRRGFRAARGDHDGRRDDSRRARDRDHRDGRAQSRDRRARRRRRRRRRGRRDVPPTAPEHHVLRRPRRGRRADTDQDAVAARRGAVDEGADDPRRDLAVAAHEQGDPQADTARLRRRAHVVARREVRLARAK